MPNVIQKTKHQIVLHIIKSKWYKLGGKLRLTRPFVCVPHPSKAQMTITMDSAKFVEMNMNRSFLYSNVRILKVLNKIHKTNSNVCSYFGLLVKEFYFN